MKPAALLRLYPRQWREKYGEEFVALLEQTGVGWRQIIDVVSAASREWVKAVVRWRPLQVVANEFRRGLTYFSIAWSVTAIGQLWFRQFADRSLDLRSETVQLQMVGVFLTSALVCRCVERLAFRFVLRGRATSGELMFLNVAAYLAVTIALMVVQAWLPREPLLLGVSDLSPFIMVGEFFGRPSFGNRKPIADIGVNA